MTFQLDVPPASVHNGELWRTGSPGVPEIGDLWLLSWDGVGLGLALISGLADSYALVWPATLSEEGVFSPGIPVVSASLGTTVTVWPTRETGVGMHLLHRRLVALLPERTMAAILEAIDQDSEPCLPFAPEATEREDTVALGERMIGQWESICYHVWPSSRTGRVTFSADALRSYGAVPSLIAEVLGVDSIRAGLLFKGTALPTQAQVELVAARLGAVPDQIVGWDVEATSELLRPEWKQDIVDLARESGVSEDEARALVQEQFALAARSNGSTHDRMRAAIRRVTAD